MLVVLSNEISRFGEVKFKTCALRRLPSEQSNDPLNIFCLS